MNTTTTTTTHPTVCATRVHAPVVGHADGAAVDVVIGRRDRAIPDVGVRQREVGILNVRRAAVAVARAAGVDQVHASELDGCAAGDAPPM